MYCDLELYGNVGKAFCISISETFATMESNLPMNAVELQEMLDKKWESMYSPVIVDEGNGNGPVFQQTFKKIEVL